MGEMVDTAYVCKRLGPKTRKRVNRVKRKHRTDVDEWSAQNHASKWSKTKEKLEKWADGAARTLDRVDARATTPAAFRRAFEAPSARRPCVLTHGMESWEATSKWTLSNLRSSYGERKFKCGEDDDGHVLKLKLKHFLRYQRDDARLDDSPLYVFDSGFEKDDVGRELLSHYRVPELFREDLFKLVGDDMRPPYRWMLFGPERSGSCVHIDPLGTSAWNALVTGRKLWALFPPSFPRKEVKGAKLTEEGDDEAVDWFSSILPSLLRTNPDLEREMIVHVQLPGEIMFVPSNWHHAVLNLDDTVAVTQNFASTGNFDAVWRRTRTSRKKMSVCFLAKLEEAGRTDLVQEAARLDALDGFNYEDVRRKVAKRIAAREARSQARKKKK